MTRPHRTRGFGQLLLARAAVSLAGHLPWPDDTQAVGVVAAATPPVIGLGLLYRDTLAQSYRSEAQRLQDLLSRGGIHELNSAVESSRADQYWVERRHHV